MQKFLSPGFFAVASSKPIAWVRLSILVIFWSCVQPLFAISATITTMSLTTADGPVTSVGAHTAVTLTATVNAGPTALKAGQVKFCDAAAIHCQDIHLLGVAQLTTSGTAVLRFVPGPGVHSYNAVFAGTHADLSSESAPLALTVSQPTTDYRSKTTLSVTGSAGAYTLGASVVGTGTIAPFTGEVYFLDRSDSNYELGKARLTSGSLTFSSAGTATPFLHQGTNTYYGIGSAATDFNNDGKPDVVGLTGTVPVTLLGNGDGTFTELLSSSIGVGYDRKIFVGDFNEDGNQDAIATYADSSSVRHLYTYFGDGTGKLQPSAGTTTDIDSIEAIGDFNEDGHADLVVGYGYTKPLGVLLGQGDGTFKPGWKSSPIPFGIDTNVVISDFNGDGHTDFATVYLKADNTNFENAAVYYGQGDGTFNESDALLPELFTTKMAVGDFDGDGRQEIVFGHGDSTATILSCNPDGTIQQKILSGFAGDYTEGAYVGDFNGDGLADVAFDMFTYGFTPVQQILLGRGDGSFIKVPSVDTGDLTFPSIVAAADFDGDGLTDLAASGYRKEPSTQKAFAALLTQPIQTSVISSSGRPPLGDGPHEVVARYSGSESFISSVSTPAALAPATDSAVATLSTTSLQFSNDQQLTVPSHAKTVTLTNTGHAPLTIGGVSVVSGAGLGASFATSNDCPAKLAAGATCTLRVRFVPSSDGYKVSRLTIVDNAANSPQVVLLSGKSKGSPQVSLTPGGLIFDDQANNTKSDAQSVIVTNTGDAKLNFSSIVLQYFNSTQFVMSHNCSGGLIAGASCTIRVRYFPHHPHQNITDTAQVVLTDDAADSPHYVALQGAVPRMDR